MKTYLEQLKKHSASILSDAMNRMNCMSGAIKSLKPGVTLAGTARTVKSMVGGNWGTHKALTTIKAGEILVVDARGHTDTAVWGLLQTKAALMRKVAGVIIDGAIRDSLEISKTPLIVFCRGITPAGPHKGWKDEIDTAIQCGGVVVNPGDFIKGDDDGVVVIPKNSIESVLHAARKIEKKEKEWFKNLNKGVSSFDCIGLHE